MPHFIGLDVGTSGAKGLLIDLQGRVVGSATEEYPMAIPKPLWAEQNPDDWWRASVVVLRRLVADANIDRDDIKGIGLTGQMHGLVLLDSNGSVLRPCIMWNDQRTATQCADITQKIGADRVIELTGNQILPGFTAPKIVWVRENEPNVYEKIAHILLPKDYLRYRLSGDFMTEVSDAAGTSLLDVRARRWSEHMLSALEIPREWLPPVVESFHVTGKLSASAAREIGLKEGVPIGAGGGDQAAGAVGTGVVRQGVVSVTIGTSGVVFAHSDNYTFEPRGKLHAFCHSVPNAWHLMGVTLSAGGSLRWLRDSLGELEKQKAKEKGIDPYDIMMEAAAGTPPGSEGLLFLPYLSGERTPHPDPHARGAFLGLSVRHTKSHMIRSVLEGVAFSLRDCLELMKGLNIPILEIRASGGGARSALWRQILANVFQQPLVTVTSTEGAPYGAALLAAVGTGHFSSVVEACDATIKVVSGTAPQKEHAEIYRHFYQVYRQSYPALKPLFHLISTRQL
jgi:xylulokinase